MTLRAPLTGDELPPYVRADDYCDCADGSDEPGTSACADGRNEPGFFCQNRGFRSQYVRASHVNDGVCDCCDGTDEYTSGACPENCTAAGDAMRAEVMARLQVIAAGLEKVNRWSEEGSRTRAVWEGEVAGLQESLSEKKKVLSGIEEEKKVAEARESEMRDAYLKKKAEEDAAKAAEEAAKAAEEEAAAAAEEATKAAEEPTKAAEEGEATMATGDGEVASEAAAEDGSVPPKTDADAAMDPADTMPMEPQEADAYGNGEESVSDEAPPDADAYDAEADHHYTGEDYDEDPYRGEEEEDGEEEWRGEGHDYEADKADADLPKDEGARASHAHARMHSRHVTSPRACMHVHVHVHVHAHVHVHLQSIFQFVPRFGGGPWRGRGRSAADGWVGWCAQLLWMLACEQK